MTTQSFLTLLAELVAIGGAVVFTSLFAHGAVERMKATPKPETAEQQLQQDIQQLQERRERLRDVIPFKRPVPKPVDLSSFTIRELKSIASRVNLPRYNACKKAELQARLLAEVERDRLMQAIEGIAA